MELREDGVAAALAAFEFSLRGQETTTGNLLYAMRKGIEGYVDAVSKPAPKPRCQATQYGDEMKCGRCGLSWDVKDADRPDCSPKERRITSFEPEGLVGQWDRPIT